jgi:hypothetical protein
VLSCGVSVLWCVLWWYRYSCVCCADCRRSKQGWTHGPHTTARGPSFHAPAHKTGTQTYGSTHIGHHATGLSALCWQAWMELETPDLSTAGGLAMMAVTSEWSSCLARSFGFVVGLLYCSQSVCVLVHCADIISKKTFRRLLPCNLVNHLQGSGGSCCFSLDELLFYPEDGGCTFLWNITIDLQGYMASHTRNRHGHCHENQQRSQFSKHRTQMKSTAFWDSPLKVSRRFGGTYPLHLQDRRISRARNQHESLPIVTWFPTGFLLCLFFDPEDGGDMFLQYASWLFITTAVRTSNPT